MSAVLERDRRWAVVGFDTDGKARRVSLNLRSESEATSMALRYEGAEDVAQVQIRETVAEVKGRSYR